MRRLRGQTVLGVAIVALALLATLLAPWLAPCDPLRPDPSHSLAPSSRLHPLGTDALGRDTLSRLLYGARLSVALPLAATLLAAGLGGLLGAAAGYLGGVVDGLLVRILDTLRTVPLYVLALALVGVAGPGLLPLLLILVVTGAVGYARVARTLAIGLRGELYVTAAIACGARSGRIIVRHIVPHLLRPLWAMMATGIGQTVLLMAGLSFLGVGVQPPTPEWGAMLFQARGYLELAPQLILYPGACIALVIAGFMLLGDAVAGI